MIVDKNQKYRDEINRVLNQNELAIENVSHAMNQFRHILEINKVKEKYKYLNMYCNWTVHTQLSDSLTCFKIFEFVVDGLVNHQNDPGNAQWIGDAIIEGIALHKLWEDILNFSQEYNLDSYRLLSDNNNWVNFASRLLDTIKEKPIKWPDNLDTAEGDKAKKIRKLFNKIRKKSQSVFNPGDLAVITSLEIIDNPDLKGQFMCRFYTLPNPNIIIISPIAFRTNQMIERSRMRRES